MAEVAKVIEVKVVAPASAGEVTVTDFLNEVRAIHDALNAVADDSGQPVVWRIADLHHSDAVVWFGTDSRVSGERAASLFVQGVRSLASGRDAEELGSRAIDAIRAALRPVGLGVAAVEVGWAEGTATLDVALKRAFERVSFKTEYFEEEWEGQIEVINLHSERPFCRLFPAAGPDWITCEFEPNRAREFLDAVQKKVSISGRAAYRPRDKFPHRIVVNRLTALDHFPDDLDEMTGSLAGQREELMTALKQVRDGWGE